MDAWSCRPGNGRIFFHSGSATAGASMKSVHLWGAMLLWVGGGATAAAAAGPSPVHAYEFQGDLSDSAPGDTPITSLGGVAGPTYFEFDPAYHTATFPGGVYQGLTLENPQLANFGVYSIEMRVKLDSLRNETPPGAYGEDQGWVKLLDFTNNSFSQGLYVEDVARWGGPGEEGKIEFIASGGRQDGYDYVGVSPDGVIQANTWFHTVLTRDSSGTVACYLDGVKMFEFADVWDDAVLDASNNALNFMQPDSYALTNWAYPVIEVTQGDLDYLRVYDHALTAAEVVTLFDPPMVGDYNEDGRVDAVDYAVWRENVGSAAHLPNDPVGGVIGESQLQNWLANYGGPLQAARSLPAPEPGAAWLLLWTLLGIGGARLRGRQSD